MFSFVQRRSHDTIRIQKKLLSNLELFQKHPELINKDKYIITSDVDPAVVDIFFSRVGGDTSEPVTAENAEQLRELCDELRFSGFDDELRMILGSNAKVRKDSLGLRGRIDRHDVIIEELQRRVIELERQLQKQLNVPDRVEAVERCVEEIRRNEMEGVRAADVMELSNEVERLKQTDQALRDELRRNNVQGAITQVMREAGTLREDVRRLRSEVSAKASTADVTALSNEVERLKQADQALRDELRKNSVEGAEAKRETGATREDTQLKKDEFDMAGDLRSRSHDVRKVKEPKSKHKHHKKDHPKEKKGIHTQSAKEVSNLVDLQIRYDEAQPLNGIMAHLKRKYGVGVHDQGLVVVKCSGEAHAMPQNMVDPQSDSFFRTTSEPNSWICYEFKAWHVVLTSYSIRTANGSYPKSWVVEVSNEGTDGSWEVIDRRDNNFDLSAYHVTRNFPINSGSSASRWNFCFIRLRQTGKNHSGNDCLSLSALEFFGRLIEVPRPVSLPEEFPFYVLEPLNGIIAHLTSECHGNVHTKGVVEVTASSNGDCAFHVVDLGTDSYFWSSDEGNQWVCYDFKHRRVALTNYSLRTYGAAYPKSWVLEVCKDRSTTWYVVDRRENEEETKFRWATRNFVISTPPHGTFRFVRLRMIGKNHDGCDVLSLSSLELFGSLVS